MRAVVVQVRDRVRAREQLLDERVVLRHERARERQVHAAREVRVAVVQPGVQNAHLDGRRAPAARGPRRVRADLAQVPLARIEAGRRGVARAGRLGRGRVAHRLGLKALHRLAQRQRDVRAPGGDVGGGAQARGGLGGQPAYGHNANGVERLLHGPAGGGHARGEVGRDGGGGEVEHVARGLGGDGLVQRGRGGRDGAGGLVRAGGQRDQEVADKISTHRCPSGRQRIAAY